MFTFKVREWVRKLLDSRKAAKPSPPTTRPCLQILEDRTMPSVVVASPAPAPQGAAITSFVDSIVEQKAQLISTMVQDASNVLNTLGQEIIQEFAFLQLQMDRFFGIIPNPQNSAPKTSVTPTESSNSAMGRGNSGGLGSDGGALTTAHNTSIQSQSNSTQQSGPGSDSGSSATTTANGNVSQQGSMTAKPMTRRSGSGGGAVGTSLFGTAYVKGKVFLDNNGDGSEDDGESGFPGITVDLIGDATGGGGIVGSAITDSNGNYQITVGPLGSTPTENFHVQVLIPTYDYATFSGSGSEIDMYGNSAEFGLAAGDVEVINAGIASMNVTTTQDDPNVPIQGKITLRDAIETGNNSNFNPTVILADETPAVTFYTDQQGDQLSGTISLQAQLPAIKKSYNIDGPGSSTLTVNGNNNAGTIFTVNAGVTSTISGLTIEDGSNGNAGGVLNNGNLTLETDVITSNQTTGSGGGIYNSGGALTLNGDQIINNTAGTSGGGLYNASGTVTITGGTSITESSLTKATIFLCTLV